jgi:hypothetical protein
MHLIDVVLHFFHQGVYRRIRFFLNEIIGEISLDLLDLVRDEIYVLDELLLSLSEFVLELLSLPFDPDLFLVDLVDE